MHIHRKNSVTGHSKEGLELGLCSILMKDSTFVDYCQDTGKGIQAFRVSYCVKVNIMEEIDGP